MAVSLETQILEWLTRYGYGAALPAVLSDPAGIPWAWVFLMLLAQEAGKNVTLLLFIGFAALWACDLILYFIGARWGTRLVEWLETKRPSWKENLDKIRSQVQQRGALAIIIGRYLPLVGRWMGLGAGIARVPTAQFVLYSAIGAAFSAFGFGIPAHLLGRQIVDHPRLMPIAIAICAAGMLSGVLFMVLSAWRSKSRKTTTAKAS